MQDPSSSIVYFWLIKLQGMIGNIDTPLSARESSSILSQIVYTVLPTTVFDSTAQFPGAKFRYTQVMY